MHLILAMKSIIYPTNGATQEKKNPEQKCFWNFAEALPGPISKPVTTLQLMDTY